MAKLSELIFKRSILLASFSVIQLLIIIALSLYLSIIMPYYFTVTSFLSLIAALVIINEDINPSYKVSWLILIMLFPIFGLILYTFFRDNRLKSKEKKRLSYITDKIKNNVHKNEAVMEYLRDTDSRAYRQAEYIAANFLSTPSNDTCSTYFSPGELLFDSIKKDLKKAEHYIFIEFYIIETGRMWDEILEILKEKREEGVEVRIIYDDIGCIARLSEKQIKELNDIGIQTASFNQLSLKFSIGYNFRNHRKIVSIDGRIAYTGGINIGDNYINTEDQAIYWKDSGVRVEGEDAWSLSMMFLSIWEFFVGDDDDYAGYKPAFEPSDKVIPSNGIVQAFSDNPLTSELITENIFLNMIYSAKDYIYIKTPYLIPGDKMKSALTVAAKSGIDVRIMMPGVPDKKMVNETSKSYYADLISKGVKIYEYTPGFMHEKVMIADDIYAINSTANMDYRSMCLSFECGLWFYKARIIEPMKEDFTESFKESKLVTMEDIRNVPKYKRLSRAVFRLFSPLM